MADSRNRKDYKMEMQKSGVSIPNTPFAAKPMVANPVSKRSSGLGGSDFPHPFKASKPTI